MTQAIPYVLRESARAKHARITVRPDAVIVTRPVRMPMHRVERFVADNEAWLAKAVARIQRGGPATKLPVHRRGTRAYRQALDDARRFIETRLSQVNATYGYSYTSISIRSQKSRWGSCSRAGDLSFNYRIMYLPLHLADYVIAHELCHLEAFDHSPRFWALVARAIPDHKARRTELRTRYSF